MQVQSISTIDGLKALAESDEIRIISIGATHYKDYGFATEKEFPKFTNPVQLVDFFSQEEEIGLIDFKIEIVNKGSMSSHDDGECNFKLKHKSDAISILKKVAPVHQVNLILAALLSNNGIYISIDESGTIKKFATFEDYLKRVENK